MAVKVPRGYAIRALEERDEPGHISVMRAAGFVGWNEKQLAIWKELAIPGGIMVALKEPEDVVVATAMASRRPTDLHPEGGELGWVAASPLHRGKGLGHAICRAAIRRFLGAGYRGVYLLTDDHRLAAIKVYLRLRFVPFLFDADMEDRWVEILKELEWPADRDSWLRAPGGDCALHRSRHCATLLR